MSFYGYLNVDGMEPMEEEDIQKSRNPPPKLKKKSLLPVVVI